MKLPSLKKSMSMLLASVAVLSATQEASARQTYNFNSDWNLSSSDKEVAKMLKKRPVTLPHAWNEDESFKVSTYEMPTGEVWYKKKFRLPAEVEKAVFNDGNKIFIEFEGARQAAEVFQRHKNRTVGKRRNGFRFRPDSLSQSRRKHY